MLIKKLTSDCKLCNYFIINNNSDFICNWGRSKKKKKLIISNNKNNNKLKCNLFNK
jgi:hypothetical protein